MTIPANKAKVITVLMNTSISTLSGCPYMAMATAADAAALKMGVDPASYTCESREHRTLSLPTPRATPV